LKKKDCGNTKENWDILRNLYKMKTMLRREGGRVRGGNYYYCCCCCYSGGGDKERNIISIVHILIYVYTMYLCGPGSSIGIATDYGLVSPGSSPGGDEIFCQSRLALGPTQPPVQWVPGLSRR
jgi:hypothetical protein